MKIEGFYAPVSAVGAASSPQILKPDYAAPTELIIHLGLVFYRYVAPTGFVPGNTLVIFEIFFCLIFDESWYIND